MRQIEKGDKLVTIVRSDLSKGQIVVQSCHAVADFAIEHKDEFKSWKLGSNYLCCLQASLPKIYQYIDKLAFFGIKHTIFREPDIGNEVTALAVEALNEKTHNLLYKNLKLTS